MAVENKYGKISPSTKAIGRTTKRTAEDDLFIPMETYTKATGKMTRHMAKVSTTTMMAVVILDNGLKTYRKVLGSRDGLMDHIMRANIEMDLNMAGASLFGLI